MSTCRSCGQVIDWIKTEKGRNMPLDPEYVTWDEAEDGTVLVDDSGHVLTVNHIQNSPNVRGRISHFATCPQGDAWRRGK